MPVAAWAGPVVVVACPVPVLMTTWAGTLFLVSCQESAHPKGVVQLVAKRLVSESVGVD